MIANSLISKGPIRGLYTLQMTLQSWPCIQRVAITLSWRAHMQEPNDFSVSSGLLIDLCKGSLHPSIADTLPSNGNTHMSWECWTTHNAYIVTCDPCIHLATLSRHLPHALVLFCRPLQVTGPETAKPIHWLFSQHQLGVDMTPQANRRYLRSWHFMQPTPGA